MSVSKPFPDHPLIVKTSIQSGSKDLLLNRLALLKILSAYLLAGLLLTTSFIANFPSSNNFLGWVGTQLNFSILTNYYGTFTVNIPFLGLTFFPGLLVTYVVTNYTFRDVVTQHKISFHPRVKRGYPRWKIFGPFLSAVTVISLVGTFFGFLVAKLFLFNRIGYVSDLMLSDALIADYYAVSFYDALFNFLVFVVATSALFYAVSLRHLIPCGKLEHARIEPNKSKVDESARSSFLRYTLTFLVSLIFLLELIQLEVRIEHPVIIILSLLSIATLIVSAAELLDLLLHHSLGYKPEERGYNPEGLKDLIQRGYRFLTMFFGKLGIPFLIIGLGYVYTVTSNVGRFSELMLVVLFVVGIVFLTFYIGPKVNIRQSLLRISWLDRKPHYLQKAIFLTLLFTILVWQSSTYLTISQAQIEGAYFQNYGADVRAGLDPALVSHYGLQDQEMGEFQWIDGRITSVLRYYVNEKHAIVPKTDEAIDLLMFDTKQYIDDGFFIRDDWFEGGTAEELFLKLNEDPNGSIILDINLAKEFKRNIGDKVVLKPYLDELAPTGIEYQLTIIGLVKYFPAGPDRQYSYDSNDYQPYGIMHIEKADAQFQLPPIFGQKSVDKVWTTYWLFKTLTDTPREHVLNKTFYNENFKFLDIERSATVETYLKGSIFIGTTYRYYQVSGASVLLYFLVLVSFGVGYLSYSYRKNVLHTQNVLFHQLGIPSVNSDLVELVNQILLLSFSLVIGVVIGTVFTKMLVFLLLPPTVLPVLIIFEFLTPVLIAYVMLVIASIILFVLRNLNVVKDFRLTDSLVALVTTLIFLPLPIYALFLERRMYDQQLFTVDNVSNGLVVVGVSLVILMIMLNILHGFKSFRGEKSSEITRGRMAYNLEQLFSVMFSLGLGLVLTSGIFFVFGW